MENFWKKLKEKEGRYHSCLSCWPRFKSQPGHLRSLIISYENFIYWLSYCFSRKSKIFILCFIYISLPELSSFLRWMIFAPWSSSTKWFCKSVSKHLSCTLLWKCGWVLFNLQQIYDNCSWYSVCFSCKNRKLLWIRKDCCALIL